MATINKKSIKVVKINNRNINSKNDNMRFYNDRRWDSIRNSFYIEHPLCCCCLENGKVTPTEHIHHVIPFMSGRTEEIKWKLFLDTHNLVSLCKKCHYGIHDKMKQYNLISCKELTKEEYEHYQEKFN